MRAYAAALALFLTPSFALGGGGAEIQLAFPAPPTLAVIQPGVQVAVDLDDEVFYTNRHYWLRRDGDWYRARHYADPFMPMEGHHVPSALMDIAPGYYRHYHPTGHPGAHGHGHRGGGRGGWHGCGGC